MSVLSSPGGRLPGRHIADETDRSMGLRGLVSLACSIFGSTCGAWGHFLASRTTMLPRRAMLRPMTSAPALGGQCVGPRDGDAWSSAFRSPGHGMKDANPRGSDAAPQELQGYTTTFCAAARAGDAARGSMIP